MQTELQNFSEESGTLDGIFFKHLKRPKNEDTLALIMGYSGSSDSWGPKFLSQLLPHYNILLIDNRGTGRSSKLEPDAHYSIASFADDTARIINHCGTPMFVFGLSLGGCITQMLPQRSHGLLKGIMLVSTTPGGKLSSPPKEDMLEALAKPAGETVFEKSMSIWRLCMGESVIQSILPELESIHGAQVQHLTPKLTFDHQMKAFRNFSNSNQSPIPALIITGNKDRLIPSENSVSLKALYENSNLIVVDGAGHLLHLECPEKIIVEIRKFTAATRSLSDLP